MGEDQINKWIARIPIVGQIYLAVKIGDVRKSNHELERRNLQLVREASEIEQSRNSLEAELQKAQPKLDALGQLRKRMETHKSDMEVLQKDRDSLNERVQAIENLAKANASDFLAEQRKKENWRAYARDLRTILRTGNIESEKAMNVIIPSILEHLGIRILWFNEQEKVDFMTTAAAERLGSSKKELASKTFSEIFDCPGIDWLLDVGPRYPLLIRDTQEEVSASITEIPYGIGITYAVALREKAVKEGLVKRLVPQRLIAPSLASADYRAEVAMALAKSTGKSRLLGNDVYVDLKKTENIEPELGTWLAKIIAERNESEKQGTVFLYMPSEKVYRQLRVFGIPPQNIQLPRKTESPRYVEFDSHTSSILLARGT